MKKSKDPDLSINIGGIKLKNPVIVASGTFGFAEEFKEFFDLNQLGAIIPKGISLKPIIGNPPPRIFETEGGIINSIGLQNPGFEIFVKEKLPFLKTIKTHIILNIFGNTKKEYIELTKRLSDISGISGLEINISCPNVEKGGIIFGTNPKMAHDLISHIRKSTKLPLIVKLSPNASDIVLMGRSVEDGGADALSLVNTFRAIAIDIHSRKPQIGNIIGGLSGPAIKPIALRMVWEISQAVKIPVIGIGGIMKSEDAIEFLLAGASAIQIGTANLINPKTAIEVIKGIRDYLIQNRIRSLKNLIGLSKKEFPC